MDQEEKLDRPELKVTDRYQELLSIYQTELGEIEAITARKIQHSKRNEDYCGYIESFEERSKKVLFDLVNKIIALVKRDRKANTIYFHNFSRFDGVLILKHLVCHHDYKLKPLFRNNMLYELSVYSGRKVLFRLRDSLNLLPGTLNNLAKSLCPSLGSKGSIDYHDVRVDNLVSKKDQLIEYMKQDILLLGVGNDDRTHVQLSIKAFPPACLTAKAHPNTVLLDLTKGRRKADQDKSIDNPSLYG
ncbi:hypothetical protein L1987_89618 [Smallanthus sonchifolius]|nr:hypothetical protein L1987_89618 [Smallanthus sonchifolius]